ncbi:DUF1003 domain-containing protein [Candidatus Woesearchaeota archaeon]|nr:MAG: DUF1003 domain-containing protein [Candidatus Woesearchaeota archaeon]
MTFVYVHCVWFALWIWYNLASKNPFDPYPFGFLTLVVSLEAIILATFILVSQNREGMVNDLRAELDYQVDLKNMKTIAEIRSLVSEKHEKPKSKKRKK